MKNVFTPHVLRFGAFEVDLRSSELRKNGLKIRLTGQPFQILAILLEHPGELVMREELQKRLWPADTFVDFDRGLNAAINRVREALGDSAENPRFVETLPRRGYRFIGQVEDIEEESKTYLEPLPSSQQNKPWARNWKIGIVLGAAILATIALVFIIRVRRPDSTPAFELAPLTALPGQEISPSFSPDGSQIAFGWNGESNNAGFDLYAKVIGTDKPLRLTNHPAQWLGAAWSPDGNYIAVHRLVTDNAGIFLVPALGGPERKLISTNNSLYGTVSPAIAWSPDGKQIAFADRFPDAGAKTNLFLLSLETLERKQVETGCEYPSQPAFSPLGETLAYTCIQDDGRFSLRLKELRTGRSSELLSGLQQIHGTTWTRDGRIIFSYYRPSFIPLTGGDLWQIRPGQNESPVKIAIAHDATASAVNSSGNRLVYVQSHVNMNIWKVDLGDSKVQAQILAPSTRLQYGPAISPNGLKIAFMSDRSGNPEIWVCDSNGDNAQQLTFLGAGTTGTLRWSPNGKQIAFDSRIGEEANVYVLDADGGAPKKLEPISPRLLLNKHLFLERS